MRSAEQELRNEQGSCRKLYHGIRWFLSFKRWTDILWVDDPQVASSDNPVPFVRPQSSAHPVPEIHARHCGTSQQRQSDNADQRLSATRAPTIPLRGGGHGTGADNPAWSRGAPIHTFYSSYGKLMTRRGEAPNGMGEPNVRNVCGLDTALFSVAM